MNSITTTPESTRVNGWRLALTVALALYGIPAMRHPEVGRLLDGVDLAIHETGHLVFGPFGEFIGFLGGTLFQLIVPAAFLLYFARRGDRHAATVPLWWIAQNLWNISVYVRDARAQELPLVGGGEHDWAYLLGRLGLLRHDQGIAAGVHATGTLLYMIAIGAGVVWSAFEARPAERNAQAPSAEGRTDISTNCATTSDATTNDAATGRRGN